MSSEDLCRRHRHPLRHPGQWGPRLEVSDCWLPAGFCSGLQGYDQRKVFSVNMKKCTIFLGGWSQGETNKSKPQLLCTAAGPVWDLIIPKMKMDTSSCGMVSSLWRHVLLKRPRWVGWVRSRERWASHLHCRCNMSAGTPKCSLLFNSLLLLQTLQSPVKVFSFKYLYLSQAAAFAPGLPHSSSLCPFPMYLWSLFQLLLLAKTSR